MASQALPHRRGSLLRGLAVQSRVIGALVMRELHTRYGRENIGYLWMIGEPLLLATVIGLVHAGGHTPTSADMPAVPFAVLGYTIFILFRGIVSRAEGGIEANGPLLYHRMVTAEDITFSRAILEFCGVFSTSALIMGLLVVVGLSPPPARPLVVLAAWGLMWWYCLGHALIISAISHENRTVGRLVHPYTYFMVFLSGSFVAAAWIPRPWRDYFVLNPLVSVFELARYGWFYAAKPDYAYVQYLIGACLITTFIGLVLTRAVRNRIHLT